MTNQRIVPEQMGKGCNYVLLIEKDPLQAYLLKVILQEAGWVVCMVADPKEGLLCCENDLFDAAIINFDYPGKIKGFALANLLWVQYSMPSLMITAARYSEIKAHSAFRVGQKLLFKPYHMLECKRRLRQLVASRQRSY